MENAFYMYQYILQYPIILQADHKDPRQTLWMCKLLSSVWLGPSGFVCVCVFVRACVCVCVCMYVYVCVVPGFRSPFSPFFVSSQ